MDNQLRKLNTNVSGIARAMEEARSGTGGASSDSACQSIIEALGNQLAVLDERRRMARVVPQFWLLSCVQGRKRQTKKSRRSAN
jgi:hypothetical protein